MGRSTRTAAFSSELFSQGVVTSEFVRVFFPHKTMYRCAVTCIFCENSLQGQDTWVRKSVTVANPFLGVTMKTFSTFLFQPGGLFETK